MLYVGATRAQTWADEWAHPNYGVTITGWAQHPLPPELPAHYEVYRPAPTTPPFP